MKITLKLIIIFILFIPIKSFGYVIPETSGIKSSYYQIEWCSPHSEIGCKPGYFENIGGVGFLSYEGADTSGITIKKDDTSTTKTNNVGIIDLFNVSELKIQGEGTYIINIVIQDNALNIASYTFTYKIDKTAPQFELQSIEENSDYTYIDSRINGFDGTVEKYDSNIQISTEDYFKNPNLISYSGDTPTKQTTHNRQELFPFYYSGNDGNKNFILNTTYSDNYDLYLDNNYTSGVKNFELLDEYNNVKASNISLDTALSLSTSYLDNLDNSQKKYKLRIYDKSEGKDGINNYSEIIFYVVKDNTKPNTGITNIIKFDDNNSVWNNGINFSRFLSANDKQELIFNLDDSGIGSGTQPELYNAGIEVNKVKINIEQASILNNYDNIISFPNRFNNSSISKIKDFSIVDNNRKNGYRNYLTQFTSQGNLSGICDAVGNCLEPELEFRVVAGELDEMKSVISLDKSNLEGDDKIFANGQDYYTINTTLKDKYGNLIVGAKALENDGSEIKQVNLKYTFENGLYENLTGTGTGNKQVIIEDNQSDNKIINNNINDNGEIFFKEQPENLIEDYKGYYSFNIKSKVPTNGIYPYLNNDAKLSLINIESTITSENPSGIGTYNLGEYSRSLNFSGSSNLLNYEDDFLKNTLYYTDFSPELNDRNNYGKINIDNNEYSLLSFETNKKIQLEYSPLYIYGTQYLTLNHLMNNIGQYYYHIKEAYKLDNNAENLKIYEKYLPSYSENGIKYTPNIFNIYSSITIHTGSLINDGTIISNLNGQKEYKTKSSPINSSYYIEDNILNMGYVSTISYNVGGDTINLPSVSKNISDGDENRINTPNNNSYCYFPENNGEGEGYYKIILNPTLSSGLASSMGIAITGLTNTYESMLIDDNTGTKATVNIGENITRYNSIKVFKENISNKSKGIEWCEDIGKINEYDLNNKLENCTTIINGEIISFIKGNININCGETCKLDNNLKRTIIVKDGSVYIKSNITTYGKNSQLLIGSIREYGLENIPSYVNLGGSNPIINRNDSYTNGWVFIDPSVTNIDAYLVAQGPIVSYNGNNLFNDPNELELTNQLHIYGGLLSLNTVGGYKSDDDSKCPYIVDGSCDSQKAFIFDLITLRRYSLKSEIIDNGDGNFSVSDYLIVSGGGMRSGQNNNSLSINSTSNPIIITETDIDENGNCKNDNNLRCIDDINYIIYPLLIEKDNNWVINSSIIFDNN